MRVGEAVKEAAIRLGVGPHAEKAQLDAEALLKHTLGVNLAWLMAHRCDPLAREDCERFATLVERRLGGEPIQYIVGEAEFYGLPFRVTPDVLIPRPETEHVIDVVLALAAEHKQPRIVDVGTGSGAIAVALAVKLPDAQVTSIDISEKVLAVARENAARNGVDKRVRFLHGDLLAPVERERFEIVVSNPPYVPLEDRDSLSVEVREHEPSLALFADSDGLDIYKRLIPAAHERLMSGGALVMEIGYGQSDAIRSLLAESDFGRVWFVKDLQGIARVACAMAGADDCGCGDTARAGWQL